MKQLIQAFPQSTPRPYKGGLEIRVKNLDESLIKARRIIEKQALPVEIFDISAQLRSFAIRNKETPKTP